MKRTPQEWADFLGWFVAKDIFGKFLAYEYEPKKVHGGWKPTKGAVFDIGILEGVFSWEMYFIKAEYGTNWFNSLKRPRNIPIQMEKGDQS